MQMIRDERDNGSYLAHKRTLSQHKDAINHKSADGGRKVLSLARR